MAVRVQYSYCYEFLENVMKRKRKMISLRKIMQCPFMTNGVYFSLKEMIFLFKRKMISLLKQNDFSLKRNSE